MKDGNELQTKVQGLDEILKETVRKQVEDTVNSLLKMELTAFLGYEKYSTEGIGKKDSRNGYYERRLDSEYGTLNLRIPRDRLGDFAPKTVPPYGRRTDGLEECVIHMYRKGITTREIADLIEKMYGAHYCPATVSNITQQVQSMVEEFHGRALAEKYAVLFMDSTYLNVRRDTVAGEALHVIIGITPDGRKEVLDYALYPTEAAANYSEMLGKIKERGVKEVLLAVSDGLAGMEDALHEQFPLAEHQQCWVHLARTVERKVRPSDKSEVLDDLKAVYTQKTEAAARQKLADFLGKHGSKYPLLHKVFEGKRLFSFYGYPASIRGSIYTSNLIENNNKQLKHLTKRKEQFPNEDSLSRFVCSFYTGYNRKWSAKSHKGFKEAEAELLQMFDSRYAAFRNMGSAA